MKRHRTGISVLLGLVLLVQGVAVSAAPCSMVHETPDAASVMTMDADMPCHGQADESVVAEVANDLSCCDIDCPNMGNCMLGHAAINASFALTSEHSPDAVPSQVPVQVIAQAPVSLLRPPISFHG
jgi:hypothetical protein